MDYTISKTPPVTSSSIMLEVDLKVHVLFKGLLLKAAVVFHGGEALVMMFPPKNALSMLVAC